MSSHWKLDHRLHNLVFCVNLDYLNLSGLPVPILTGKYSNLLFKTWLLFFVQPQAFLLWKHYTYCSEARSIYFYVTLYVFRCICMLCVSSRIKFCELQHQMVALVETIMWGGVSYAILKLSVVHHSKAGIRLWHIVQ